MHGRYDNHVASADSLYGSSLLYSGSRGVRRDIRVCALHLRDGMYAKMFLGAPMEMNQYFGYGFTAIVVLATSFLWRRPKLILLATLLAGLPPVFFLRWVTEPFHQRGWWLVSVLLVSMLVYVAATAQLALNMAQELKRERDNPPQKPVDG